MCEQENYVSFPLYFNYKTKEKLKTFFYQVNGLLRAQRSCVWNWRRACRRYWRSRRVQDKNPQNNP